MTKIEIRPFVRDFAAWTQEDAATHRCLVLAHEDQMIGMAFLAIAARASPLVFSRACGDVQCITILGVMTIQVTVLCVWRLLTMVRRGTVFSHAAFRYVDVVIGTAAAASLLTFGFAVTLAPRRSPATPRRTTCRPSWTR